MKGVEQSDAEQWKQTVQYGLFRSVQRGITDDSWYDCQQREKPKVHHVVVNIQNKNGE